MAAFIVLTGLDGSGTSTIAERLHAMDLRSKYYDSFLSPFSEFRQTVDSKIDSATSAHLLFYLSSLAYTSLKIEEDLNLGYNVYCCRWLIDTIVSHRVHGHDISLEYESHLYKIRKPDFIFFIRTNEDVRQERIRARPKGKDILDIRLDADDFRQKFLNEFKQIGNQFIEVDNSDSINSTTENILQYIKGTKK